MVTVTGVAEVVVCASGNLGLVYLTATPGRLTRERIERVVSDFSIEIRSQGRARVGISVGSAAFGTDGETLDQLVIAADQAMYQAKSNHKASVFRSEKAHKEPPKPALDRPAGDHLVTTAVN
jgi:GGDEF domain-containing protein